MQTRSICKIFTSKREGSSVHFQQVCKKHHGNWAFHQRTALVFNEASLGPRLLGREGPTWLFWGKKPESQKTHFNNDQVSSLGTLMAPVRRVSIRIHIRTNFSNVLQFHHPFQPHLTRNAFTNPPNTTSFACPSPKKQSTRHVTTVLLHHRFTQKKASPKRSSQVPDLFTNWRMISKAKDWQRGRVFSSEFLGGTFSCWMGVCVCVSVGWG